MSIYLIVHFISLDLRNLLEDLSKKMNQLLCSRDSFSNLSDIYSKETMEIHSKTLSLGHKLLKVLDLEGGAEDIGNGMFVYVMFQILLFITRACKRAG